MAIFKCKMCGGDLEILENATVCECEYCGTKQTLPKLNDEKRVQLYDRANYFRRENEFDKAMGIYEMILSEANDDAESYWGIVLCRYGIEYVEDPKTHKRIPTVNRAQFTSIFDDEDYKKALEYADVLQKEVYEAEAGAIDKIQKGILDISNKEEPFDIFICYKETDENGQRTKDSVYAQSIYDWLVKQGYKVFFSRITLEDKLGSAYEPYIFAALNSARVMLVVGTKKEYFNAVWVKNEWSRYLSLIKAGKEKTIIPVYKDISPYDLPEEFQYLQAQDMNKIGFSQDLGRGIRKLIPLNEPEVVKETVVVNNGANATVDSLLKRVTMFLEDGDFKSANEYCEKVLDVDPENALAYLGKLMVELKVCIRESLKYVEKPFDHSNNYQKALRFGNEELKAELTGYIEQINTRNEKERVEGIYNEAKNVMSKAKGEKAYKEAAELFESIIDYSDSKSLCEECKEKAENARKNQILTNGKAKMKGFNVDNYKSAIELFESIPGWKDADEQIPICKARIEEILNSIEEARIQREQKEEEKRLKAERKAEEARIEAERKAEEERIAKEKAKAEAERIAKKNKKIAVIAASIACVLLVFVIILNSVIIPSSKYNKALGLMESGEYKQAIVAFKEIADYKDSKLKSSEILEKIAVKETISAGGSHTVGLKSDGTVVATKYTGDYYNGQCEVEDWTDIVAISAGSNHTVGLKSDGTVVATEYTGDMGYYLGQCDVQDWKDIVAISAGYGHTVGLKSDGTVVATEYTGYMGYMGYYSGECDVQGWTDIVAISAGGSHTVGLKLDGTVVATEYTRDMKYYKGECDVQDWTDIVAISAGGSHTVGLKSDGTVVGTGSLADKVKNWTDIVAISAGNSHTVGLKSDGTVVAVGDLSEGRHDVDGWTDIVAISAGSSHTVGLKSDGTVVAAGSRFRDDRGQCDVQDWKNIKLPNNS